MVIWIKWSGQIFKISVIQYHITGWFRCGRIRGGVSFDLGNWQLSDWIIQWGKNIGGGVNPE